MKILEKPWVFPGFGSNYSSMKMSEEAPPPKNGREKLAGLLADLLGFQNADKEPDPKTQKLNLYESMSSAFRSGGCVFVQDSHEDNRTVIYENCLKCQSQCCRAPPRVGPADRKPSSSQAAPAAARRSQELLHQTLRDEEQSAERRCQSEGKRPLLQLPVDLLPAQTDLLPDSVFCINTNKLSSLSKTACFLCS